MHLHDVEDRAVDTAVLTNGICHHENLDSQCFNPTDVNDFHASRAGRTTLTTLSSSLLPTGSSNKVQSTNSSIAATPYGKVICNA